MRKRLVLGIALLLSLSLVAAACGDDGGGSGSSSTSDCPKTPEKGDPNGKKVGLMFDITGRGDQSFNDAAACGLDRAVKEFKLNPKEYPPTGDNDRADRLKLASTTDGRELVVANGFLWATPITDASKQYANVKYTIIDSVVASPNVLSITFTEEQGSYLVGVAAALKSKSGKIGFIGGVEQDLIKKFQAGFVAGAKAPGAPAARPAPAARSRAPSRYPRTPMSKRTSKRRTKARKSKANHGTKPNAGRG